jgi:hypothetical protein
MGNSYEASDLQRDLLADGYSLIDHGIDDGAVDDLMQAYANFTDNLPEPPAEVMDRMLPPGTDAAVLDKQLDELDYSRDDAPDWHKYRTNHPHFAKPGGYTNRSVQVAALEQMRGVELQDDPKEYYHYSPDGLEKIIEQHERYGCGSLPPEVHELHQRFEVIHGAARLAMTDLLKQLEETNPDILSKYVTPESLHSSPLRLLFYHPGQGDMLAAGHYDKGFATIQIAESHEGLRLLDPKFASQPAPENTLDDDRMRMLRRSPEKGAFFLAHGFGKTFPDSDIKPEWHDVINSDEFNEGRQLRGRNVARWSLIFFSNAESLGAVGKDATHQESKHL